MSIDVNAGIVGMGGRYRFTAIRPDGSERVLSDWFDNLLLNSGLDLLGQNNPLINTCYVGTGTTPPAPTQTELDNQTLFTGNVISQTAGSDISGGFAWFRRVFRFAVAESSYNVSEVGIAGSTFLSRSLVKDGSGNPTTITVLTGEMLNVTYEFRLYWPTGESVASVNIEGVDYTVSTKSALVGSWGEIDRFNYLMTNGLGDVFSDVLAYDGVSDLGGITENISGSFLGRPSYISRSGGYVTGTYHADAFVEFNLDSVTQAINGLVLLSPLGIFKMKFAPDIPKNNGNILQLNFRATWARREF